MTRGDHPSRRQRSSQRRKNALAGIERNRARIFRVADGRFDAPCHRMRRLESWLVVIDAEHIAAKYMTLGLASVLLDAFVSYRLFPISEIPRPHSPSVSLKAIVRPTPQSQFCDLWMSSASRAAKNRQPQGALHLPIRGAMAIAKPAWINRLRPAGALRPPAPCRGICRPRA